MFSYRHAFHAGNHADMLKHLCLHAILQRLGQKPKPMVYIDTHAGAGLYDLSDDYAQKTGEYQGGVGKFLASESQDPLMQSFKALLTEGLADNIYPGSPEVALRSIREQDKAYLMEWHNTEIDALKGHYRRNKQVAVHHRDGFEGLLALVPPKPARGLVLMDPPYEQASEYLQVVKCLKAAVRKWPTGVYALWYPLLAKERDKSLVLLKGLEDLPVSSILNVQLTVAPQAEELGMHGSGMLLLNAPWQLDQQLKQPLKELSALLGEDGEGRYRVEWLKEAD